MFLISIVKNISSSTSHKKIWESDILAKNFLVHSFIYRFECQHHEDANKPQMSWRVI